MTFAECTCCDKRDRVRLNKTESKEILLVQPYMNKARVSSDFTSLCGCIYDSQSYMAPAFVRT